MKKVFTLTITIVLLSSFASADFYTGNDLLSKLDCDFKGDINDLRLFGDHAMAWGYTIGVFDLGSGEYWTSPIISHRGRLKTLQ